MNHDNMKKKLHPITRQAMVKSIARRLVNSESIAPKYAHEILGISEKEAYRQEMISDEERGN